MCNKKIFFWKCIIIGECLLKGEFFCIVYLKDGVFMIDFIGKVFGCGFYIIKSVEVCEKVKKKNVIFY